MKKNKQNNQFIALLFLALALFVGIFLVTNPVRYESQAGRSPEESYTKIQSPDDLDRALMNLENSDLDSVDAVVNQNEDETSGY